MKIHLFFVVIVNRKKMNIIGRAWNCKSLTYERTQNSCASDSRLWLNKSIELNDNIVEICQQTRIEGISINPEDYDARIKETFFY